jgi:hypothetical protein
MALGSKFGLEWMLVGLAADLALANQIANVRREKEQRYAFALLSLIFANRIRCVNDRGAVRFGVAQPLPTWLESRRAAAARRVGVLAVRRSSADSRGGDTC